MADRRFFIRGALKHWAATIILPGLASIIVSGALQRASGYASARCEAAPCQELELQNHYGRHFTLLQSSKVRSSENDMV